MDGHETAKNLELLTFRLGEQEYALDIMSVREIRGWSRTTPLPHAPKHVKGVVNLRGTVLPVMDLAVRFGQSPKEHCDRNVVIVVKHCDTVTGLLVDAVSDIITLDQESLQPPPDLASNGQTGVIRALTLLDERMIRILDLETVIANERSDAA
ncbi:MAG: chemotaxis protein CheW [Pseudomonadota bacterium]